MLEVMPAKVMSIPELGDYTIRDALATPGMIQSRVEMSKATVTPPPSHRPREDLNRRRLILLTMLTAKPNFKPCWRLNTTLPLRILTE